MSEESGYNPEWWKAPMKLSLERKARTVEDASGVKPGDSFLIVTEGEVTEPVYLDLLKRDLQLSAVRIRIEPGSASHPRHVIETAAKLAEEQIRRAKRRRLGNDEPAYFDHVWAVIDADVALREEIWNDVLQLATARKVKLAFSAPCFEFWLLLHKGFTTRGDLHDGEAAKQAVKSALEMDYSTNEETAKAAMKSLIPRWPEAVTHAARVRKHHEAARTPPPGNPSTEVDLLARALDVSAPAHLRKLKHT